MFRRIRKAFALWKEKQRLKDQMKPEAIRSLARELMEMASMVERLSIAGTDMHLQLQLIQREMKELEQQTHTPEFILLPFQERAQLRTGLLQARHKLMEAMKNVPTPTTMVQ